MIFDEKAINMLYDKSLDEAEAALSSLAVAEGGRPRLRGLNGWVFEKVVRYCISHELHSVGVIPAIEEQAPLVGRARIDLIIGKAAVEIKAGGSYGSGDSKYQRYRKIVEERGQTYIYLTLQESHPHYRKATQGIFGSEHSFFLDTPGDWAKFVQRVTLLQP